MAFLSLLSAAFIYSLFGIFIRHLNTAFGPFAQVGLRSLAAVVILAGIIAVKKYRLKLSGVNFWQLLLFSVSLPVGIVLFTKSVLEIKVASTVFYFYASSLIFSLGMGMVFFKEKLHGKKLAALLLAFISLILFSYPLDIALASTGVISGLLAGIFDAVANAMRKFLGSYNFYVLLLYQFLMGTILMIPASFLIREPVGKAGVSHILLLTIYGLCLVSIGWLTLYGFNKMDLNLATIIISMELPFAMVVNYYAFKETPSFLEMTGSFLLFGSLILIHSHIKTFREKRMPRLQR